MTTPHPVASARQQLWKVDGFDGYFATKEGGEVSGDAGKVWDGGELEPELMAGGPAETSNITLTKPYRPTLHAAKVRDYARQVMRLRTTVSGYDSDPDLGPIGEPITYADSLLVRVKRPDHSADSSDPGMFELEFAVTRES